MQLRDVIGAVGLGVLEGVTEWLPVSSTGHLILLAEWLSLGWSEGFWDVFLVGVQLGAILAVAVRFFARLCPVSMQGGRFHIEPKALALLGKILVACLPVAVVGLLWGESVEQLLYHPLTIGVMLTSLGVAFVLEKRITARICVKYTEAETLPMRVVLTIGLWQVVAALLPGTSRSGATMLGGLLCGVSATAAAEFSFFLGVPVMAGASALKLWEHGGALTANEWGLLAIGAAVAFGVSLVVINTLLAYFKRGGLAPFGWYRILLGVLVLGDMILS